MIRAVIVCLWFLSYLSLIACIGWLGLPATESCAAGLRARPRGPRGEAMGEASPARGGGASSTLAAVAISLSGGGQQYR